MGYDMPMSEAKNIFRHVLDDLRSISVGVLANGLTTFLGVVATSGWVPAIATISPPIAASVIGVAVALNIVRGQKANITKDQADRLLQEIESLSTTHDSSLSLLKELATKTKIDLGDNQLALAIDAIDGNGVSDIDDRLAQEVYEHLNAASQERLEIKATLDKLYQASRLYLSQIDSDQQKLKEGQQQILEAVSKNEMFLKAISDGNKEPNHNLQSDDITINIVNQLVPAILAGLKNSTDNSGAIAETLNVHAISSEVIIEPPPLVSSLCERESTVTHLLEALANTKWLAIQGESGTGKTQLVTLLARRRRGGTLWIRLRNLDVHQAANYLDACMLSQINEGEPGTIEDRIGMFCRNLQDDTLLVLDDLPDCSLEDSLGRRLITLYTSLQQYNARLLTTSAFTLRYEITERVAEHISVSCPQFSDAEIVELFLAYGAETAELTPNRVRFLRTITSSHPVLLVAAARFLKDNNWEFSDSDIQALLLSEHTKLISEDIIARLIASVNDEGARDLLYRLMLIVGYFSSEDIAAVASVSPEIARPAERIHKLTGLWVQRESKDEMSISPILKAIPTRNIPDTTYRAVNELLGQRIIKRQTISPWELMSAINHYASAELYDNSVLLLINGLGSLIETGDIGEGKILLHLWDSTPIPSAVSPGLQLILRAHQIQARGIINLPIDHLLSMLQHLLNDLPNEEGWALLCVATLSGEALVRAAPGLYNRVLLHAYNTSPEWRLPDGKQITLPDGMHLASLFWYPIGMLFELESIIDWINTVKELDPDARDALFSDRYSEDSCMALALQVCNIEYKKPENDRDWSNAISMLSQIETAVESLNQPFLNACVVRSKMIVYAEHLDDLDEAIAIAESILQTHRHNRMVAFIVYDCIASQYLYRDRMEESRQWFDKAFATSVDKPKLRIALSCAHAARAYGDNSATEAVRYAEKAVSVLREIPLCGSSVRIQLLGELAIAKWRNGDRDASYSALDEAAEYLVASQSRDEVWKALFVRHGHTCGFYAHMSCTGQPPPSARDGGKWIEPDQGFFMRQHEQVAEYYDNEKASSAFLYLLKFAEGIQNNQGTDKWSRRGLQAARIAGLPSVVAIFADQCIPGYVTESNYGVVLNLSIESARAGHAAMVSGGVRPSPWAEYDVDKILEENVDTANEAERQGAAIALLPISLHLASAMLEGAEEASNQVESIIENLERMRSKSEIPEYWDNISDALDRVFIKKTKNNDLIQYGNQSNDRLIKNIAYLSATIDPEISLEQAFFGQLAVLSSSPELFDLLLGAERRIVLPFIESYWKQAFERERFRFSSPTMIESDLQKTDRLPIYKQVRTILQIVGRGLVVRVPEYERKWLYG